MALKSDVRFYFSEHRKVTRVSSIDFRRCSRFKKAKFLVRKSPKIKEKKEVEEKMIYAFFRGPCNSSLVIPFDIYFWQKFLFRRSPSSEIDI